jgi:hypothetical protein
LFPVSDGEPAVVEDEEEDDAESWPVRFIMSEARFENG